jgi:hypothetical protein
MGILLFSSRQEAADSREGLEGVKKSDGPESGWLSFLWCV